MLATKNILVQILGITNRLVQILGTKNRLVQTLAMKNKFVQRLGAKNMVVLHNTKLTMTIVLGLWIGWFKLTMQIGWSQIFLAGGNNGLTRWPSVDA